MSNASELGRASAAVTLIKMGAPGDFFGHRAPNTVPPTPEPTPPLGRLRSAPSPGSRPNEGGIITDNLPYGSPGSTNPGRAGLPSPGLHELPDVSGQRPNETGSPYDEGFRPSGHQAAPRSNPNSIHAYRPGGALQHKSPPQSVISDMRRRTEGGRDVDSLAGPVAWASDIQSSAAGGRLAPHGNLPAESSLTPEEVAPLSPQEHAQNAETARQQVLTPTSRSIPRQVSPEEQVKRQQAMRASIGAKYYDTGDYPGGGGVPPPAPPAPPAPPVETGAFANMLNPPSVPVAPEQQPLSRAGGQLQRSNMQGGAPASPVPSPMARRQPSAAPPMGSSRAAMPEDMMSLDQIESQNVARSQPTPAPPLKPGYHRTPGLPDEGFGPGYDPSFASDPSYKSPAPPVKTRVRAKGFGAGGPVRNILGARRQNVAQGTTRGDIRRRDSMWKPAR